MRTLRRIVIALLTVSIGFSTAVVTSETCRKVTFDALWAAKLKAQKIWNKNNPGYVKEHNLTRDMSKQTARSKAWLKKQLEVQCASLVDDVLAGSDGLGIRDIDSMALVVPLFETSADLPLEDAQLSQLIAKQEYPSYENPSRDATDDGGFGTNPGFGGWYGGGGYAGGHPGSGNSVPPPITTVPEPSTFVLVFAPFLSLFFLRKRR
jgi:hypothetical protein